MKNRQDPGASPPPSLQVTSPGPDGSLAVLQVHANTFRNASMTEAVRERYSHLIQEMSVADMNVAAETAAGDIAACQAGGLDGEPLDPDEDPGIQMELDHLTIRWANVFGAKNSTHRDKLLQ